MGECYHMPERALWGFLMGHAHEIYSSDVDLPRGFGIMAGRSRDNGENPRRRRGPAGAAQGLDPHRRWTGGGGSPRLDWAPSSKLLNIPPLVGASTSDKGRVLCRLFVGVDPDFHGIDRLDPKELRQHPVACRNSIPASKRGMV